MQTLNIKKLISCLCGFLIGLLVLLPFSGCNQRITEETSPFQFDGRDRTMSGYALTGEKQNYEEKIWITVNWSSTRYHRFAL